MGRQQAKVLKSKQKLESNRLLHSKNRQPKTMKKLLLILLMAAPLSLFAQKFAHFDYTSVMQNLPEYKAVSTELETLYKKYQTELESMKKELQTKAEKYAKEDTDSTPDNIKERHNQELQDMYQRLQQAQEDNTQAFQKAQETKMQPVTQKVLDAVNAVAKEGQYVYVMDKNASQAAGIIINEAISTDITAQIKAKLGIQ